MKLLVLLALVALGNAETPPPTAATTTLSISATRETPSKYEKEKRTTSAEISPQNVQYGFSEEAQPTSYITHQYVKIQSTKPQDLSNVPQKTVTETKKKENPDTSYTIQYVPAQHISHGLDIVPKFQTVKYNQILQKTQEPLRFSGPVQNSIIPQQQYFLPAPLHGFTGSSPHYIAAPTAYHPSVPGHHIFSPANTFIVPQHSVPSVPTYSLQPLVMMFTIPGGNYLNTAAGQSALLSILGGAGNGRSAPSSVHTIPHQLTYLVPPEANPTVRQASPTYIHQSQHPEQQQQTSGTVAYTLRSPQLHQYQNIKG